MWVQYLSFTSSSSSLPNRLDLKQQTYNNKLIFVTKNSSKVYILWMDEPSIDSNLNTAYRDQHRSLQSQLNKEPLIEKPWHKSRRKNHWGLAKSSPAKPQWKFIFHSRTWPFLEIGKDEGVAHTQIEINKIDRVFTPLKLSSNDAKVILNPIDYVVFNGMSIADSIKN